MTVFLTISIMSFQKILDQHAPVKQTKLCGNTIPHVNKILRKEIKRSRLKNKANKTGSNENVKLNKTQRIVVIELGKSLKKVVLTHYSQALLIYTP